MKNINNECLKLAIQKQGRLTDETLEFLRKSGLKFEASKQKLFSTCRNFPLEIVYLRYDDIPNYVESGVVDLGIIGQNFFNEEKPTVEKLLDLKYSFCSLIVAVPKESPIEKVKNLQNLRVATSYPNSTRKFFKDKKITLEIIPINGSVEISPALGIADAIVDLVSTGSTLALNDLKKIDTVYESEAILIANRKMLLNGKKALLSNLLTRFKGVLTAKEYKYVMMNAPEEIIPKLKEITPGLKSPTISPLGEKKWVSVQTVIREDIFWETIEKLKQVGATGIIVLPIEKMIT